MSGLRAKGIKKEQIQQANQRLERQAVSYTHLTLPTKLEV